MFSLLPSLPCQTYHFSTHAPQVSSPLSSSPLRSSPLSPRHVNLPSRPDPIMSSPTMPSKQHQSSFSKRPTKKNPLIHRDEDGRETRRKLFLKRVRADSEDKRWEARGGDDEMMRTIWTAEHKRWLAGLSQDPSYIPQSLEEEEEMEDTYATAVVESSQSNDEEMADMLAQLEEAELEALVAFEEPENADQNVPHDQSIDTPYASDEEEYDQLFLNMIQDENSDPPPWQAEKTQNEDEMMDLS